MIPEVFTICLFFFFAIFYTNYQFIIIISSFSYINVQLIFVSCSQLCKFLSLVLTIVASLHTLFLFFHIFSLCVLTTFYRSHAIHSKCLFIFSLSFLGQQQHCLFHDSHKFWFFLFLFQRFFYCLIVFCYNSSCSCNTILNFSTVFPTNISHYLKEFTKLTRLQFVFI